MEIFHEGLPRSGKSYEAMVRHIIPALQAGRHVFGYIEGLDDPACQQRVAEAAELSIETVREYLHGLTREQVPEVYKHVTDNSLVVLDEAQNFWPTGRQKLGPEITQFIAEHGHRGLDVLLMGQDIRDVHPMWRRRVSQKVVFNKLDALGAESRYSATVYKAVAPEQFNKVTTVIGKYDPKYFGTYKSHVDSTIQTGNYKDSRANVRNTVLFKWVLPAMLVFIPFGLYKVWSFFHTPAVTAPAAGPVAPAPVPALAPPPRPAPLLPPAQPVGPVAALNAKYRARLGWFHAPPSGFAVGTVEWWEGDVVRERLTLAELRLMGVPVDVVSSPDATLLKVAGVFVTHWPEPRVSSGSRAASAPALADAQQVAGR